MTAGEVCDRQIVFARSQTSVVDAVRLMKTQHVGDVVVVRKPDGERVPIGILTDRDVALALELTDLAKLVAKGQERERDHAVR